MKVQPFKTSELHKQEICSPAENMFGIIKALSENLLELEEGKYILMRDPNEVCFIFPFFLVLAFFFANFNCK